MTAPPVTRAKPKPAAHKLTPEQALDHSLLAAELMDRNGYAYLIHPLLDGVPRCEPEILQAWVDWAKAQPEAAKATLLLAPEAMGLPLVAPLALALGIPYGVIRKRKYDLPREEIAYSETGYGHSSLYINDTWPDDKVLLVDDVMSTGATMDALLGTLAGMDVQVVGVLVAVDKGTARETLSKRRKVTVRALRTIRIVGHRVEIVPT